MRVVRGGRRGCRRQSRRGEVHAEPVVREAEVGDGRYDEGGAGGVMKVEEIAPMPAMSPTLSPTLFAAGSESHQAANSAARDVAAAKQQSVSQTASEKQRDAREPNGATS
jgi:hypothetical protein